MHLSSTLRCCRVMVCHSLFLLLVLHTAGGRGQLTPMMTCATVSQCSCRFAALQSPTAHTCTCWLCECPPKNTYQRPNTASTQGIPSWQQLQRWGSPCYTVRIIVVSERTSSNGHIHRIALLQHHSPLMRSQPWAIQCMFSITHTQRWQAQFTYPCACLSM